MDSDLENYFRELQNVRNARDTDNFYRVRRNRNREIFREARREEEHEQQAFNEARAARIAAEEELAEIAQQLLAATTIEVGSVAEAEVAIAFKNGNGWNGTIVPLTSLSGEEKQDLKRKVSEKFGYVLEDAEPAADTDGGAAASGDEDQ